jgi:hypothetical protein
LLVANLVANRELQRALKFRDRWIFSELFMACIRWQRPIPLSQVQSAAVFAMKLISVTSSRRRVIVVTPHAARRTPHAARRTPHAARRTASAGPTP